MSRQDVSADDLPDMGIWKSLIVPSVLNRMRIDRYTPLDWLAAHVIGLWYATQERAALQSLRNSSPVESNLIPWGACLPVRIHDWDTFASQPVGTWLRYLPSDTSHPYRVLLFYLISEPAVEAQHEEPINEHTRDVFESEAPSIAYVIDLCFPIELADIDGPSDPRLPDTAFFQTYASRATKRLVCHSPSARPSIESWNIMYSGEVIEIGVRFNEDDLIELDNDPERADRFGEAYVRALRKILTNDRLGTSRNVYHECVSHDYWNRRRSMTPSEFRSADARTRLLLVFTVVYLARTSGLENTPNAKRLENALVRFVRSEFEIGWPTETAVLDLLNSHGLDTGRIPTCYTTTTAAAVATTATATTRVGEAVAASSPIDEIRRHILSTQPTTREAIMRSYQESIRAALPSFGNDMDDSLPDLCALSAKRDSGCGEGIWLRNARGLVEHRKGSLSTMIAAERGESFVLADGYPVRFYYVRGRTTKWTAYAELARSLHEQLGAGRCAPKLKGYTVGLVGERELVVYPGIVVRSLEALRTILGPRLVQNAYHSVPFGELWCTLPAFSDAPPGHELALLDPQPSIQNCMIGIRATLMTNIVRDRDGQHFRYAYSEEALKSTCEQLRKLYSSGKHPTEIAKSNRLPVPTVYWLRPSEEVSQHSIESLPEDTRQHIQALPRVDRFSTDSDQYGTAVVMAYRDVPFLFAEELRSIIRTECQQCMADYNGRFEDYLRDKWGIKSPASVVRLVEGISATLFHAKPLRSLFSSVATGVPVLSSSSTEASSLSLEGSGSQCGTNNCEDSMSHDDRKEDRQQLWRIADRLAAEERRVTTAPGHEQLSMIDAISYQGTGGWVTAAEAFQAKAAEAANKQFRFRSLIDELKILDPMLDTFRRYPDRFIQAIWERPQADPKTSIHLTPAAELPPNPNFPNRVQKKTKKGDWLWIDRHTDVGGLGPFTLMGYTYCFMAGRSGYTDGGGANYHPNGVKIEDIIAVKKKNKADRAGPVAFVGELIELVKAASKRLDQPCEAFTAWWRRLVEPLYRSIRAEEEARAEAEKLAGREPAAEEREQQQQGLKRKRGSADPGKSAAPNSDKEAEEIRRWWETSTGIEGLPASYLRVCRGLDMLDHAILERSPFLRFLDPMPYKLLMEDGRTVQTHMYPCLLAFCVSKSGLTGALQRIYLGRRNGDPHMSKAALPQFGHNKNKVKLSKGALKFDSHYFLAQPGRIEHWPFVYLSEGPEKALAVAACSRLAVCFATFGVSRYDGFEHFKDMKPQPTIVLAGDADHTLPIQMAKAESLRRNGWERVLLWVPTCVVSKRCQCKDANDVIENHGIDALRVQLLFQPWTWQTHFDEHSPLYEPPEKEWRRYDFLKKYTDH